MRPQRAPITVERQIWAFTAKTHGIIGNDELRALGLSQSAIQRRIASGRLVVLHRGIYLVGPALSAKGRWLAAVRACGPGARLSYDPAAALWEMRRWTSRTVDVSVPGRGGHRAQRGIRLHRPTCLPAEEVTVHDGIPVTTVPRTLLDLAAVLPRRSLERAIDAAERLGLLDEHELRRTLERNKGRHGASALRALLHSHAAGSTHTRTDIEELLLALCDDNGIPRPIVNAEVGAYSPDFLWPEQRLIVETDGRESHGTRAAFEHDRARDAWLTANGYRVVRFTYRQVLNDPKKVARLIAKLLRLPPPALRSPA